MELYILDNNDLSILSILECSSYEINLDNQFTDKSVFRVNKAAGQIKDNFLVVNGLYQQFLFIIDEVEATDKEEKFVNLVCSDISNIFNRKIIEQETELMNTRSIEYFLAHMIDINFINSNDSFLNKDYIEVTYNEHTQAKVQTNAENGIYNFHTFMENCREYQNVYTDFKIEDKKLKITISYKNDTPIAIDTTLQEVTHYNKVYEQDITAKVQVYIRENGEIRNYFLKTDRTITTNINDPNRASGVIEVISVETPDDALQEATNVFKGNTYKHLVEFSISKNSKLVDTSILYIGRPIIIKTPDGIYESIISGISLDDDNYVNFKTGNIRINFIDKLKQEKDNYGNKLDVTGGIIKGNLTTQGNSTTNGDTTTTGKTTTGSLQSNGNTTIGKTDGTTSFQIHGGSSSNIYWKEHGYGDQFRIIPEFGGVDDSNKLRIQGAVGGAGETPSLYDLMTISGKNGNLSIKGNLTVSNWTRNTSDTWMPVIKNGTLEYTQRKIVSSQTHTDYNNNQDFLPTMSFLSFWNGAYNSSNNSNLKYAHQGTIQCQPTITTANGGYAIKYPDGLMICGGQNIDMGSQTFNNDYWGMLNRSGNETMSANFAATFTTLYSCQVSAWSDDGVGWMAISGNATTSRTQQFKIIKPKNNTTTKNVRMSYIAIGRWK